MSEEPTLEIEIAPLDGGGEPSIWRRRWLDGGVVLTMGTNNLVDLVLPRERYPTIGQRVLRLLWREDGLRVEAVGGPVAPVLLDGEKLSDERPVREGDHELQLGAGHRFRLRLRTLSAALPPPEPSSAVRPSRTPYKDDDESCERTDVKLLIYPRTLDPSEITRRLRVAPSRMSIRGVEETTPSGIRRPAPNSLWALSTEGRVQSRELRRHIDWLIERLLPVKDALRELQADAANDVRLVCVWWSNSDHSVLRLSPEQIGPLAELGLEVTFDISFYGPDEEEP